MKKIIILLITIAVLIGFVSCNADQEIGIFAEVANSQEVAGINIIRYMGSKDSKRYILAVDGIYENKKQLFESSPENGIVVWASLNNSNGVISVLLTDGTLGTLNKTTGKIVKSSDTTKYVYLTMGGLLVKPNDYDILLECGSKLLVAAYSQESGKYVCYISDDTTQGTNKLFNMDEKPVGFQKLGNNYILMDDHYSFWYVSSIDSTPLVEIIATTTTFSAKPTSQIASFYVGEEKAYFKASSTFLEVTKSNVRVTSAASEIANSVITNIVEETNDLIAATKDNGLYKIDKTTLKATPITL